MLRVSGLGFGVKCLGFRGWSLVFRVCRGIARR